MLNQNSKKNGKLAYRETVLRSALQKIDGVLTSKLLRNEVSVSRMFMMLILLMILSI
jgi:hypothetical protein